MKKRCKVIDPRYAEYPGYSHKFVAPRKSLPHIDKLGYAERGNDNVIKITLDDGNILYGYECWWEEVVEE
jgi:hypothetical protein